MEYYEVFISFENEGLNICQLQNITYFKKYFEWVKTRNIKITKQMFQVRQ